jgi:hypothetical protein
VLFLSLCIMTFSTTQHPRPLYPGPTLFGSAKKVEYSHLLD